MCQQISDLKTLKNEPVSFVWIICVGDMMFQMSIWLFLNADLWSLIMNQLLGTCPNTLLHCVDQWDDLTLTQFINLAQLRSRPYQAVHVSDHFCIIIYTQYLRWNRINVVFFRKDIVFNWFFISVPTEITRSDTNPTC